MAIMIEAIWPSYANIPNHIAENQGIDTKGMLRFVPRLFTAVREIYSSSYKFSATSSFGSSNCPSF
jgi:hypothetical protein